MTANLAAPETQLATVEAEAPLAPARRWGKLKRFCHNVPALLSVLFLLALVLMATFASVLAPQDPDAIDLTAKFASPGGAHLLGTDEFGRDVTSRLIYGARVSLTAALVAVGIAIFFGVLLGLVAGYASRRVDAAISHVMDVFMSVPALVLAITIVAILGRGLVNAMIAIGIATIPRFYRVTRAQTKVVTSETFIEASRAAGGRRSWILAYHVFPNTLSPVLVQASLALGAAVTAEAGLSFLGLGVTAPTASWGSTLQSGTTALQTAPMLAIAPGILITLTVLAFTLAGDGVREVVGTGRNVSAEVQS